MNIGIDLLAFSPNRSGGIEFYIRNLLFSLAQIDDENQYYLFTNYDNHAIFDLNRPNFHRINIKTHARPQIWRIGWEQIYLPIAAKKFSLDVLHSPSYTYPVLSKVPGVLTICDMLYKVRPRSIGFLRLIFWNVFIPLSIYRCKKILTISDYSKRDIVRFLNIEPQKIAVTPLALDNRLNCSIQKTEQVILQACSKYGIRRPYILNVGGVGEHKNSISLVRALANLNHRSADKTLNLIITGNDYGGKREIESEALRLGVSGCVYLTGYVPREDLPALYSGAEVYVSPSYLEGFGLTVLEAMNFGTPVIISDRGALPEVGGGAVLVVSPEDYEQIADAINTVVSNAKVKEELIRLGFSRVKDFSWERTARLTLEAYREAAKRK